MQYRRNFVPGGRFFFTVVTAKRTPVLTRLNSIDVLRNAFRAVRAKYPFSMDAIVVLPDHLHCVWTMPFGDADYATRWRLIKTWFTRHCDPSLRRQPTHAQAARGEQAVWQHRYWEHTLRDDHDLARHVEYVHHNPVKHGYVRAAVEWPYSSFHRYVEAGLVEADWAGRVADDPGVAGE